MTNNDLLLLGGDKRYAYLDCLRGFTMLLVIWHHVATMSFGLNIEDSFLMELFISFRMPMFFFISGYIAYKGSDDYSWPNYFSKLLKKARIQLIPTFIFWLAGILILKRKTIFEIPDMLSGWFPGFWWFTEALFFMFLLYYTAELLEHYTKQQIAIPILAILALLLAAFKDSFQENPICSYLLLPSIARFFMFFVFGLYLRKISKAFQSALAGKELITICIILVTIFTYLSYGTNTQLSHNAQALIRTMVGFPFIIVIFYGFYNSADFWDSGSYLASRLRFIGRRTLDLYVLHFFFLPDIKWLNPYICGVNESVLQLIALTIVTITITILCLGISYILRLSPILGKYLFGAKTN